MKSHPKIDAAANVLISALQVPAIACGALSFLYFGGKLMKWTAAQAGKELGEGWENVWISLLIAGIGSAFVVLLYHAFGDEDEIQRKPIDKKKVFRQAIGVLLGIPLLGMPLLMAAAPLTAALYHAMLSIIHAPLFTAFLLLLFWICILIGACMGCWRFQDEWKKLKKGGAS